MAAAYNTFGVLQPLMKTAYSDAGKAIKKKKKGFKGPPDMPEAALPIAKRLVGSLK